MLTDENNQTARGGERPPFNAPLLKLVHHEMGNGLAVLSGYRCLLQRAISCQACEDVPPKPEVWRQQNEQLLGYLRAMRDREALLNDFLVQLRELSPGAAPEHLCQNFVRDDLGLIFGRVAERIAPLFPDKTLHIHLPGQPLFILCDVFWLEVTLEHVTSHTIAAHMTSTPIELSLEQASDPTCPLRNAKIAIQIEGMPLDSPEENEDPSGPWSQAPDLSDQEICFAMCREVLQEHGGRAWWQRRSGRTKLLCLAVPLVE